MLGLADRACDGTRFFDVDVWLDADERYYAVVERLKASADALKSVIAQIDL